MGNGLLFIFSIVFVLLLGMLLSSCKKLVEVNAPITSNNETLVYSTDASAISVLTGIYTRMSQNGINGGITSMSLLAGLSSDELVLFNGVRDRALIGYYQNNLTSSTTGGMDFWNNIYSIIFVANSAIEGLTKSNTLTPFIKSELLGESKFIRAFCYFYLVNLYGDVPLVLNTNYFENSNISRSSKDKIYELIIADLKESKELLSVDYLDATLLNSTFERVSPTKWAAAALLARTYLYTGDFINAELQSTSIIINKELFDTVAIDDVFLKNSKEAIWQLQPVGSFVSNTSDARVFILPLTGPNATENTVYLSSNIKNSFEPEDNRKRKWIDSVSVGNVIYAYPFKYKIFEPFSPVSEYTMILRLAEQYLIRAEARAQQMNLEGAKNDLDLIRKRAGLIHSVSITQSEILKSIWHERQLELFTEWGCRWFDLKRTDKIDEVMSTVDIQKGSNWESYKQLFPIPQSDMVRNPALNGHQNPGYN